jgi:hypothetical protein
MNAKFDLTLVNNCVEEFAAAIWPEIEKTGALAKNLMALAELKRKEGIDKKWRDLHRTIKKR